MDFLTKDSLIVSDDKGRLTLFTNVLSEETISMRVKDSTKALSSDFHAELSTLRLKAYRRKFSSPVVSSIPFTLTTKPRPNRSGTSGRVGNSRLSSSYLTR